MCSCLCPFSQGNIFCFNQKIISSHSHSHCTATLATLGRTGRADLSPTWQGFLVFPPTTLNKITSQKVSVWESSRESPGLEVPCTFGNGRWDSGRGLAPSPPLFSLLAALDLPSSAGLNWNEASQGRQCPVQRAQAKAVESSCQGR